MERRDVEFKNHFSRQFGARYCKYTKDDNFNPGSEMAGDNMTRFTRYFMYNLREIVERGRERKRLID